MTGVIIIDKPQGITSFGVVARLRKITGEKRIGHSGTLDPMATGVMTVLLGGATRFCSLLPDHNKAYEGIFRLGITTDTLDITGKVLEERAVTATPDDVRAAAKRLTGEITQVPPMYSAVSVGGRRLYEIARSGGDVERPERTAFVYLLETEKSEGKDEYGIRVECSSGTYIRTLVSDIGEALGCGATLTALRRTKANGFSLSDAVPLPGPDDAQGREALTAKIIPVDAALKKYPALTVTGAQAARFSNGGELSADRLNNCRVKGFYRVFSPDGLFLGIGENSDGLTLKVIRVYREV